MDWERVKDAAEREFGRRNAAKIVGWQMARPWILGALIVGILVAAGAGVWSLIRRIDLPDVSGWLWALAGLAVAGVAVFAGWRYLNPGIGTSRWKPATIGLLLVAVVGVVVWRSR